MPTPTIAAARTISLPSCLATHTSGASMRLTSRASYGIVPLRRRASASCSRAGPTGEASQGIRLREARLGSAQLHRSCVTPSLVPFPALAPRDQQFAVADRRPLAACDRLLAVLSPCPEVAALKERDSPAGQFRTHLPAGGHEGDSAVITESERITRSLRSESAPNE